MQIGRWQLDREQRKLSDETETLSLTPRSWDVLLYLLDNRGTLVRTDTLLERFWRGAVSDETYVRKSISEIRKALGDDVRAPVFIKTVPKLGYVFLWQRSANSDDPASRAIAVLPFANISGDRENEHFADGITEEILNRLTQRVHAPVIARTSSFQFKGVTVDVRSIGRSLNASHILEGSVRKAADSVRITAQLIDATSGAHLWSETYQRVLADVFVVQDEIASTISREVRRRIGARDEETPTPVRTVYVSDRFVDRDDFKRIVEAIRAESGKAEGGALEGRGALRHPK